jgi:thiol:disulfide interchange protein DsbC
MRKSLCILAFSLLVLPMPFAYGFSEKGKDCSKCHTLGKEEAASLLQHFITNPKVLDVLPSPIKGVWEVDIEAGGKKGLVYIDFSKKHLLPGPVFSIAEKKNLSQERMIEITKIDPSQIPLDDALVMGEKDAKHRVIVFDDPECPHCSRLYQEMKKVIAERKDIAFYIKMLPLPIHPQAYEKAKAIVCKKSLSLLDDAFEKKELPKPDCETKVLDENISLSQKLGIMATPTMVFSDGRVVPGAADAKTIIGMVGN